MNELLPIIRRKRRPLIEEESEPDGPSLVTSVPLSPPVTAESAQVEVLEITPVAPAEIVAPDPLPDQPQPKRKKKNADTTSH